MRIWLALAALAAIGLAAAAWLGRRLLARLRRERAAAFRREVQLFRAVRVAGARIPDVPVTSPLDIGPEDRVRSPLTGMGREAWRRLAIDLLTGLYAHTGGLRHGIRLPPSHIAAYPTLTFDGTRYGDTEETMEAFCRSLWLAAPLLVETPDMRLFGRSVADYCRETLVRGAAVRGAGAFGIGNGSWPTPHIMEAAAVCIALRTAPDALWDPLAPLERRRILDWLHRVRERPVNPNNWRWFSVIVETFLKTAGEPYDASRVARHLEAIRAFHVDGGWSRDLDKFDYYSAWSLQFYPIFWAAWDGEAHPELRDEFYERNDRFLEHFVHLFSREGALPLWGRSPIYRFGAAAPLTTAFLRPTAPAIAPGVARRLASGCLLQFARHPEFLRHGIPTLGFHGEEPDVVDDYSGVGSPYWCAKIFTALSLPASHPFWTATEDAGFWADPPARHVIGRTGLSVTHDVATGHSRLYAPQPGIAPGDLRYHAPWFDTADAS